MEQPKGERKETILDLVWVDDFRRCLRHPRTMIPRKSLVALALDRDAAATAPANFHMP
jgi:hypothetical protein